MDDKQVERLIDAVERAAHALDRIVGSAREALGAIEGALDVLYKGGASDPEYPEGWSQDYATALSDTGMFVPFMSISDALDAAADAEVITGKNMEVGQFYDLDNGDFSWGYRPAGTRGLSATGPQPSADSGSAETAEVTP